MMKRNFVFALLIMVSISRFVFAVEENTAASKPPVELAPGETLTEIRPEKIAVVEKIVELPRIVSNSGKLRDAIGIETLAGIITPIIKADSQAPSSFSLKLGISPKCDCAKLKLYRVFPEKEGRKPEEISYDAIRGFSPDNKTVDVELEITPDSKLHQRVLAPKNLEPGKFLEWMPAKDIKDLPVTEKKMAEKPTVVKPEEKIEVKVETKTESREDGKILTLKIADHLIDCQGVAPMKCMQVKKENSENWEAFYAPIKGFHYQEGVNYTLKVKETPVLNPPADASSLEYELVEMISPAPASPDSNTTVLRADLREK